MTKKPIDLFELANKIRKTLKNPDDIKSISNGDGLRTPSKPEEFVVMPPWFATAAGGLLGFPFGYMVQIAGKTDSGKTSSAIEAMRCAQQQGVYVVYADTERKTTKSRLTQWGVDPAKIAMVQATHLEQMYSGIIRWLDAIKNADEDAKFLVIIDAIGTTASFREAEIENMEDNSQPGVAAKINKRGLKKLIPRLEKDQIALVAINQMYEKMGSHGYQNNGGQALDLYSALIFQCTRAGFLYRTVKGVRVRAGATAKWTIFKNHLIEADQQMNHSTLLDITSEGIAAKGDKSKDEEAEAGD